MADGNRSNTYWVTQVSVLGIFGIGFLVAGVVLWSTDFDNHAGDGFMLLLGAALFLGVMFWVIRNFRGMSTDQRAAYAWAIAQLHSAGVGSDIAQLSIAAKARAGTLTLDEVTALEAMHPGRPYPGGAHLQGQTGSRRRQDDSPRAAMGWTVIGIVGFGLSFFPVLSLLGLVMSTATFLHRGRRAQPRRLALAGIVISILVSVATIVLIVFAVLGNASMCAELGPGAHVYNGSEYTCE